MIGRERFFFNLGALGAAMMLVVAATAFGSDAAKWVGVGIGIGGFAFCLVFVGVLVHERRFSGHMELRIRGRHLGVFSLLAGAMLSVTVWQIVEASVFEPDVAKWLTLADGVLLATLACAGLVAHEVSRERVVHVLEIVERPSDSHLS